MDLGSEAGTGTGAGAGAGPAPGPQCSAQVPFAWRLAMTGMVPGAASRIMKCKVQVCTCFGADRQGLVALGRLMEEPPGSRCRCRWGGPCTLQVARSDATVAQTRTRCVGPSLHPLSTRRWPVAWARTTCSQLLYIVRVDKSDMCLGKVSMHVAYVSILTASVSRPRTESTTIG